MYDISQDQKDKYDRQARKNGCIIKDYQAYEKNKYVTWLILTVFYAVILFIALIVLASQLSVS